MMENTNAQQLDKTADLVMYAMAELKQERVLRMDAEAKLAAQEGKVLFADSVTASRESILVAEMATLLKQSGLEIGRDRLFDWLRGNGYLYRLPCGNNRPTQKSLELGVIELKKQTNINAYGQVTVTTTPKITVKGQKYFLKRVLRDRDIINAMEAEKKARQREQQKAKREEKKQSEKSSTNNF